MAEIKATAGDSPSRPPARRVRNLALGHGYSLRRRAARNLWPRRLWMRSDIGRTTMTVIERCGLEVRNGPFSGLRYPEQAIGRTGYLAAKLVGSYEQELGSAIEALIDERFGTVLNIGAGEGYYAVGFALKSPASFVRAYETDPWERRMCSLVAGTNGVSARLRIEGACDLSCLEDDELGRVLILCDCEGCELGLLQPERHPMLRTATLLVELHDAVDPTITSQILSRFSSSHEAHLVYSQPRRIGDYGELRGLVEEHALLAIWERVEGAAWVLLRPCP